jgi:hypothetical protein
MRLGTITTNWSYGGGAGPGRLGLRKPIGGLGALDRLSTLPDVRIAEHAPKPSCRIPELLDRPG